MKFFLEHYDGVLLMLGAGGITILAKTIVACIYTELLHQVHHISTTKNKWMKNTISKYETTYKMNLKINDTKSFVFMQMKDARRVMKIYEYKRAIAKADVSKVQGLKKVVFKMMKIRFMSGIVLAVRVRQHQNKKKEDKFYV